MLNRTFRAILMICVLAASSLFSTARAEERKFSFDDMAFLEGHWRGGEDFTFEETWRAAEGGVMTAMARGVSYGDSGGQLRVLEYILVSEEETGLVMRFKHYNANFTTWEKEGPTTLVLTAAGENDVTFTADPPSETVKSVRYWMPSADMLQADVVLVEDGEENGFSLSFNRAGK
jgi:hypothetical protein